MTVWGLNNCYMPQFSQFYGGSISALSPTFSSLASSIFAFGSPRYDVSDSNIFGFTPPTNFSYIPQLNNPFGNSYLGLLSFTPQFTMPQFFSPNLTSFSGGVSSGGNMFGFLTSMHSNRTTSSSTNSSASGRTSSTSSGSNRSYNTNTSLPSLQAVGYDSAKAQKLAAAIGNEAKEGGFDGRCAAHVKTAIQNAGLGQYVSGHAYQMDTILEGNPNFKQISAEGVNLKSLPAGCILVYERGVSRYSSEYGHVEVTLGNGTAGSGGITHNLRPGAKIFVPV